MPNEDLIRQAQLDHQFWREQMHTLNVLVNDDILGARNTLRLVLYLSGQYIDALKAGDMRGAKLLDDMIAEFGETLEVDVAPLLRWIKKYRKDAF